MSEATENNDDDPVILRVGHIDEFKKELAQINRDILNLSHKRELLKVALQGAEAMKALRMLPE